VHFSHQCPDHNSKTNDPKVFNLDIVSVVVWFRIEKSQVNVSVKVLVRVRFNTNVCSVMAHFLIYTHANIRVSVD